MPTPRSRRTDVAIPALASRRSASAGRVGAPRGRARHGARPRRGFALPLAILVLTLLVLLALAAIEAARGAKRSSALAETDAVLEGAAESALGDLAARWPASLGDLAVGDRATFAGSGAGTEVTTSVTVTRVAGAVWWMTAEARLAGGRLAVEGGGTYGRRRINGVLAVDSLGVAVPAALVAAGSVAVDAPLDVAIDPAAAGCSQPSVDSTLLVVGPADSIAFATGVAAVAWRRDPAAADPATLARWGSTDWTTLAAGADLSLAGGATVTAGGGCAAAGWGSASGGACPAGERVVHATGDLTVDGGSGAGVLIVEGRLRITGAFRYSGLIVARGGIEFVASGSEITGAVVAGAAGSAPAIRLAGATTLRASPCAVRDALARRAIPRPVPGRWWAELL